MSRIFGNEWSINNTFVTWYCFIVSQVEETTQCQKAKSHCATCHKPMKGHKYVLDCPRNTYKAINNLLNKQTSLPCKRVFSCQRNCFTCREAHNRTCLKSSVRNQVVRKIQLFLGDLISHTIHHDIRFKALPPFIMVFESHLSMIIISTSHILNVKWHAVKVLHWCHWWKMFARLSASWAFPLRTFNTISNNHLYDACKYDKF